ncbi:MAG: tyrosine-type recombinase/integrase [Ruminococcus sp.]|nr:tyrosine-type recombinase/integrase [Ruminococcus sp.]
MKNYKSIIANQISLILNNQKEINLETIQNALNCVLDEYEIKKKEKALALIDNNTRILAIKNFFIAKKVEGLADSTLKYYALQINRFFKINCKNLEEITTNDVRYYLAKRQLEFPNLSKITLNNERHVLNSFFSWCQSEDYIDKNPMAAIKSIKVPKRIKHSFSETEMELLRESCKTLREKAMVEVFYSTGVRCQELVDMKISDISGDQISVIGKGDKERIVYLNAKAELAVKKYLDSRKDKNIFLFVSYKKPFSQLTKGRVEQIIRDLGSLAGVSKAHPHRFRRTAATLALNRGMPMEQVQLMLGHESIGTTTLYARSNEQNVKASHKKYVI